MQDASNGTRDDENVAHVMDWLLEKLQLKSSLQNMFNIVAGSPDEVPITFWHSAACATARILPSTTQYSALVLSSMAKSVKAAVSGNGTSTWHANIKISAGLVLQLAPAQRTSAAGFFAMPERGNNLIPNALKD